MSRIFRYKESIEKFFKNKSFINDLNDCQKKILLESSNNTSFFIFMVLLTTTNSICKKHNLSYHSYFMGAGIECLYLYFLNYDNICANKFDNDLVMIIYINLYKTLAQNINNINGHIKTEKIIKMNTYLNKYITAKIELFFELNKMVKPSLIWIKNDITKYKKFDSSLFSNIKCLNYNDLINYIDLYLGTICKLALVCGWILGNGEEKQTANLEKIAIHMARMIKISNDYMNLNTDLSNLLIHNYTYNSVISLGLQYTFSMFQESKTKFVEGCMSFDIYTNTTKEIIDSLEEYLDIIIDNTVTSSN